jgi:uncharacterized membrane protein
VPWATVFRELGTFGFWAIVVFAISAASTGLGWILGLLLTLILLVVFFGGLIGLIYAAMKAYQGVTFKLPIVGNMAEKWA